MTRTRRKQGTEDDIVQLLHNVLIGLIRLDRRDLTIRQVAVFLTCYLYPDEEHTVRGLAARLRLSRPAISRILDRLSNEGLIRRRVDRRDRRSILIERTRVGREFLQIVSDLLHPAKENAPPPEQAADPAEVAPPALTRRGEAAQRLAVPVAEPPRSTYRRAAHSSN